MEYPTDPSKEYLCYGALKSRGFTRLMHMVMHMREYKNYDELEQYLKDNPGEIDRRNAVELTALMLSVANCMSCSTVRTVEILINAGSYLNARSNWDVTALIIACINGNNEVAKLLIDAKCNLDIQDYGGWTALMIACRNGNVEIVKLLVNAGCDLNIKCGSGWSALMRACVNNCNEDDSNRVEIVKLLIGGGCDINLLSNNKWVALNVACTYHRGNIGSVQVLIDVYYGLYVDSLGENDKAVARSRFLLQKLLDLGFVLCYDGKIYDLNIYASVRMNEENMLND